MNEVAVHFLEAAVDFHGIDSAENVFRADGEDHTLSVVLTGSNDPDDFAIVVEDGCAAIAGVGCDRELKSRCIALDTGSGAHIPFPIHDLRTGITKCQKLFAQFAAGPADALGQAVNGM